MKKIISILTVLICFTQCQSQRMSNGDNMEMQMCHLRKRTASVNHSLEYSPLKCVKRLKSTENINNPDVLFELGCRLILGDSGIYVQGESKLSTLHAIDYWCKSAQLGHEDAKFLLQNIDLDAVAPDSCLSNSAITSLLSHGWTFPEMWTIREYPIKTENTKLDVYYCNKNKREITKRWVDEARQGDRGAQYNLYKCYQKGFWGFPQDKKKALYWKSQATKPMK